MKFIRDSKTDRRQLVVAAQRGEDISTKLAERLAKNPSMMLLQFSYEKQRGSGLPLLHYDVEGLWSLRTYLAKRSLCVEELMGLLEATQSVLDLCASEHLRAEGLLFDPEYVFVDAHCCPHFALLPLEGAPFQTRNSPLALLGAIGDADKLQFSSPDAEGLSRRLGELLIDLEGVFSANRFRRFIEQEQNLTDDEAPEARRSVVEPSTGSVWANAGSGNSNDMKDSGAFFWNPLDGLAEEEASREAPQEEPGQVSWADVPETPAVTPRPAVEAPAVSATVEIENPAVVQKPNNVEPEPIAAAPQPAAESPQPIPAVVPAPVVPALQANLWLVRLATGEQFLLPLNQQVRAGRGSSCEIRLLNNRRLSRTHVALTSTGQMLMVTDLGAANGVFVGGQRVGTMQSVLAAPGQRLRLADEDFDIRIG